MLAEVVPMRAVNSATVSGPAASAPTIFIGSRFLGRIIGGNSGVGSTSASRPPLAYSPLRRKIVGITAAITRPNGH